MKQWKYFGENIMKIAKEIQAKSDQKLNILDNFKECNCCNTNKN